MRLLFILLLATQVANCQLSFLDETSFVTTDINPNIDISNFQPNDYKKYLKLLFDIDQKHRQNLKNLEAKSPEYFHQMKIMSLNDRANQIVLLKLFKKFGWVCCQESYDYAWFIIWHSDFSNKEKFMPFIKKGNVQGCVPKNFYEAICKQLKR